jgi:SAM-dependent methyltransferase
VLRQAALLQEQNGLTNVSWTQGDVTRLPYRSQQFTLVTARFAFHHFPDPLAVLTEMVRVCQPDGRILVVDSAPAARKADAFNRMERLRDPSHTRALCEEELLALFREAGLVPSKLDRFRLPGDLNSLLAPSFPLHHEDAEEIARLKSGLIPVYQPVNAAELLALERIALGQQAMLRAARLEATLLNTCIKETIEAKDRPFTPMSTQLAGGFLRLARQSNGWSRFLRYQAQAECEYRRVLEDFASLKALRTSGRASPRLE